MAGTVHALHAFLLGLASPAALDPCHRPLSGQVRCADPGAIRWNRPGRHRLDSAAKAPAIPEASSSWHYRRDLHTQAPKACPHQTWPLPQPTLQRSLLSGAPRAPWWAHRPRARRSGPGRPECVPCPREQTVEWKDPIEIGAVSLSLSLTHTLLVVHFAVATGRPELELDHTLLAAIAISPILAAQACASPEPHIRPPPVWPADEVAATSWGLPEWVAPNGSVDGEDSSGSSGYEDWPSTDGRRPSAATGKRRSSASEHGGVWRDVWHAAISAAISSCRHAQQLGCEEEARLRFRPVPAVPKRAISPSPPAAGSQAGSPAGSSAGEQQLQLAYEDWQRTGGYQPGNGHALITPSPQRREVTGSELLLASGAGFEPSRRRAARLPSPRRMSDPAAGREPMPSPQSPAMTAAAGTVQQEAAEQEGNSHQRWAEPVAEQVAGGGGNAGGRSSGRTDRGRSVNVSRRCTRHSTRHTHWQVAFTYTSAVKQVGSGPAAPAAAANALRATSGVPIDQGPAAGLHPGQPAYQKLVRPLISANLEVCMVVDSR